MHEDLTTLLLCLYSYTAFAVLLCGYVLLSYYTSLIFANCYQISISLYHQVLYNLEVALYHCITILLARYRSSILLGRAAVLQLPYRYFISSSLHHFATFLLDCSTVLLMVLCCFTVLLPYCLLLKLLHADSDTFTRMVAIAINCYYYHYPYHYHFHYYCYFYYCYYCDTLTRSIPFVNLLLLLLWLVLLPWLFAVVTASIVFVLPSFLPV